MLTGIELRHLLNGFHPLWTFHFFDIGRKQGTQHIQQWRRIRHIRQQLRNDTSNQPAFGIMRQRP